MMVRSDLQDQGREEYLKEGKYEVGGIMSESAK